MNDALWKKAVAFHGHACPGLAIGYKAVEAAMEKLDISPDKDEEILCVTENDACGVDAVQALLSCTAGKGNLIFRLRGKMAFSFFNRTNGKSLRMVFSMSNQGLSKEEYMDKILNAPIEEAFTFHAPAFTLPDKAQIFTSLPCEVCGEMTAEPYMRLQNGKKVCLDCFIEYKRNL